MEDNCYKCKASEYEKTVIEDEKGKLICTDCYDKKLSKKRNKQANKMFL